MLQNCFFLSITEDWQFAHLVEDAITQCDKIGFKPNTVAKTIRNPYYRFGTHDKDERQSIMRKHRNELSMLSNIEQNQAKVLEILEDYDFNNGLLTKNHIQSESGLSRYKLNILFDNVQEISEMYFLIRGTSITSKYYKNI